MHMRTKKWARPELSQCSYYTEEPEKYMGHWRECFAVQRPMYMELGCGKGVSTAQMVHANRDINYLALDISRDVLGDTRRNLEKAFGEESPDNVFIVKGDIGYIHTFMSPEDHVGRIYISFCNPWQRPKHKKRRLTHPRQLLQYRELLEENGEIWFKTDDDGLYHDSLDYFAVCGYEAVYTTGDLHASGFQPNYVSEHEKKFSSQGIPIKFGIFRKKELGDYSEKLKFYLRQAEEKDDEEEREAE